MSENVIEQDPPAGMQGEVDILGTEMKSADEAPHETTNRGNRDDEKYDDVKPGHYGVDN